MAWMAAIPAIVSAVGSFVGGERANRARRDMADNAHQREVADLRAAGLNPILSGTGGAGSAVAQVEDTVGPAVNSALSQRVVNEEIKNMKAQRKLVSAQSRKEDFLGDQAQTNAGLQQRLVDYNYQLGVNTAHAAEQNNEIMRQELSQRDAQQELLRMSPGDLMKNWKNMDIGQLNQILQSVFGTANSARSLMR